MNRKLRALGLTFFAALVFGAFAAQAAQATYSFTAEKQPVFLTGEQTTQNVFTTTEGTVKCNTAVFEGTSEELEAEEQKIQPHYSNCTAFGLSAHVNATGCYYTFTTPTVDLGNGERTGAPPHLVCPEEGKITITPTLFGFSVCTSEIEEQTPTEGHVIYKNTGGTGKEMDIEVESTVEGIHYKATGGACGEGGGATNTDGTYTGSVTLRGYEDGEPHDAAHQVGITVS